MLLYSKRRAECKRDAPRRCVSLSRSGDKVAGKEALDNHHIAPHAVQLSVFLIDAHFAKSQGTQELPAGRIFDKDTRHQFPEASLLTLLTQTGHRQSSSTIAAPVAPNIDGKLCDSGVTRTHAIGSGRSISDDLTLLLHHHNRVDVIKPGGYHGLCS